MQYFKCKHYLAANPFVIYYHGSKVLQAVSTYTLTTSSLYDYTGYGSSVINYYEMNTDRVQVEININTALTTAIARGLKWEDKVNYVMTITTDDTIPFTALSACWVLGGFDNLDGNTVNCRFIGTNQLIIEYFSKILVDHNGFYTVRVDMATAGAAVMGPVTTTIADVYIYASA